MASSQQPTSTGLSVQQRLDALVLGRWTGIPIMLLLLGLIFWLTIVGASYPSQLLFTLLQQLGLGLEQLLLWLHTPPWLLDCLLHGVYQTLTWVIAVMLPPMAIFFPLFALLEDCGYLPRVAWRLNGFFRRAGTCGRQCLTSCMALGCNAAGVIGCQLIDSPRERRIAILTNSFIPCNGRLPILIAMLTLFFTATCHWLAPILLVLTLCFAFLVSLLVSRLLADTLLKQLPSTYQDAQTADVPVLPPYRLPGCTRVVLRTLAGRILFVASRAVLVAAPAGLVLWLLSHLSIHQQPLLHHMVQLLQPVAAPLGMDGVILLAFLLGWPANELVIPLMLMMYLSTDTMVSMESYQSLHQILTANGWSWQTAVTVVLFTLFHWPCSTTCLTIRRETGSLGWMLLAILLPTATGLLCCAAFHLLTMLL